MGGGSAQGYGGTPPGRASSRMLETEVNQDTQGPRSNLEPVALDRRRFLSGSSAVLAGCATAPVLLQNKRSEEGVRFAVIGLNGRGRELRRALALVDKASVTALCDVDERLLAREVADTKAAGFDPFATKDLRRVLERDDVDALLIATPNHWHALAGIWGLQAGKHIYVEKPVSHSVWEGEQLGLASTRFGPIAAAGTQNRSDSGHRAFVEWRRTQDLGRIRYVHAVWYRLRDPIGKVSAPQPVDAAIDHDLFCGPRPITPVQRTNYHYDWHWQWPFGNGEIGNLGSHLVDDVRWLTGVGFPRRVLCAGGRYLWDDDGETPNVSLSVFDYDEFPALLELRNLPLSPQLNIGPTMRGLGSGVMIRFERGWFLGTRAESRYFAEDGTLVQSWRGDAGKDHLRNFSRAIRRNEAAHLTAPLEDVVKSSATCHLANLAWRSGREATLAETRDTLGGIDPALAVLDSIPQHLAAHGIAPDALRFRLGGWLEVAPNEARFVSGDGFERANLLLKEEYRAPFSVPKLG